MRRFQETPAFWRYFGARLKPFTRPLFLGSVGFLSLSGIAIYQYWNNPDFLQNQIEQPLEAVFGSRNSREIPQVSEEDLAAAADVDNIELLLQEIEQNRLKTPFNSPVSKENSGKPDNEFTRFQKKQQDKFKNSNTAKYNYLGTKNNALNNLLKPPSLNNYPSNLSTKTFTKINSNGSTFTNTSNPVGTLYLSNKNSLLNSNISSPYLQTSPLSDLGDKSGNFNIREQGINRLQETNIPENSSNITNSNSRLNQQRNINNFSNSSGAGSSSNQTTNGSTGNTQNRVNNFPTSNFNRYVAPTPNYNRSVPGNYQLQPQSFTQQTPRNFSQINSSTVNTQNRANNLPNNNFNRYVAPTPNYNRLPPNNYQSQSRSFEQQTTRDSRRNSYRNSFDNSIRTGNILNNNILSNTTQNLNQPSQSNNQPLSGRTIQPAGQLSTSPLR